MHLFAIDRGLWGGYGIVGGHIPLGVGFAYALRYQGTDHICQLYLGDGALQTGAFHEAANLAGLWGRDGNCPVVFVVENNQYAMGTSVERSTAMTDLAAKFDAYGIEREKVDGMDLEAVIECAARVTQRVRESGKPHAVEAVTYRLASHGAADFAKYRTKEEVAQWRERDPIELLERRLLEAEALDAGMIDEIKSGGRRRGGEGDRVRRRQRAARRGGALHRRSRGRRRVHGAPVDARDQDLPRGAARGDRRMSWTATRASSSSVRTSASMAALISSPVDLLEQYGAKG